MSDNLVDALENACELYRWATKKLLQGLNGHGHWDNKRTGGTNCPLCIAQRQARDEANTLIAHAERTIEEARESHET